jgi:hypothetical protein
VTKVDGVQRADTGHWQGIIETSVIGRSSATAPLLSCLARQRRTVATAGRPD